MGQLIVTGGRALAGAARGAAKGFAKSAINFVADAAIGEAEALIYGPAKRKVTGPRIESFRIQSSTEGAPLPMVLGRARLAGQIIWASKFNETVNTQRTTSGGKGNRGKTETTTTEYLYSISIAIGICTGEVTSLLRSWADGKLIDISQFNYRFYEGSIDQLPDNIIEVVEGSDKAPSYRGVCYIVFEDLPLAQFGNRIPQFNFEVERQVRSENQAGIETLASSIMIIPATGEETYATTPIQHDNGLGAIQSENQHYSANGSDFFNAMEQLETALPRVKHTALTVSWFGTDLRAGQCQLRPGVETLYKTTLPRSWQVGPTLREEAHLISQYEGAAAYGGTPSDSSVIEAIKEIQNRGMSVLFTPFILMDIPQGNVLHDPSGDGFQSAYPWRGRIRPFASAIHSDIANFFGTAQRSDFSIQSNQVVYTGPDEWSLRRMILHYAMLCKLAGGVEGFLLGSEMVELTKAHSDTGEFPAVTAYKQLAGDVRAILGPSCEISYGADWSEYAGVQGGRHPGNRFFHLDNLWADVNVDFIGIDNYMPISDWRPGNFHLDSAAGYPSIYDIPYLQSNIRGGDGYDWYYASQENRQSQNRTPITDTAYGEDWVFRVKDLWSWWGEQHYDRLEGVKRSSPTPWVPKSKPIRFTELGCGAINFGSNQPNVFFDPKSVESGRPHFSTGSRDDKMQRHFIEAHLLYWADRKNNPISPLYNAPMVDPDRIYLYCWDARPFPVFPSLINIWADGENWQFGHWLNGRVGRLTLSDTVEMIAALNPDVEVDTSGLGGLLSGFVIDRPMSIREMIEPLSGLYQFDAIEVDDHITFRMRTGIPDITIDENQLEDTQGGNSYSINRSQREDQPVSLAISFIDEGGNYDIAVAQARNPAAIGERHISIEVPLALSPAEASGRAALLLGEALGMREKISFTLPPSLQRLEPGDVIRLNREAGDIDARILEVTFGDKIEIQAVTTNASLYEFQTGEERTRTIERPVIYGMPTVSLMDLPLLRGEETAGLKAATSANPWPGQVAFYTEAEGAQQNLRGIARRPAQIGLLKSNLNSGPLALYDRVNTIKVDFPSGSLESIDELTFLAGGNLCAVMSNKGSWEVLQFKDAELIAPNTWKVSTLLRGQSGTELEAQEGAPVGALFVLLDGNLAQIDVSLDEIGLDYAWRIGPASQPSNSQNYAQLPFAYEAVGLRPLSPVHLRAVPEGGDYHFSWIRRTRYGGDLWGTGEPPIAEETERYLVRVTDQGTVIREDTTQIPSFIYTALMQTNDFPGAGLASTVTFQVAQLSALLGPGRASSIPIV